LAQTEWNISKAARELDIDRQTLYNKMNKYAIKKGES
jgi:transcriptional regulator of acetoin/glycerol metabolism